MKTAKPEPPSPFHGFLEPQTILGLFAFWTGSICFVFRGIGVELHSGAQ